MDHFKKITVHVTGSDMEFVNRTRDVIMKMKENANLPVDIELKVEHAANVGDVT